MALQSEDLRRFKYLDVESSDCPKPASRPDYTQSMPHSEEHYRPQRPKMRGSVASSETIRATAPMKIPSLHENGGSMSGSPQDFQQGSYMDHYMRNRNPSHGYDRATDSGEDDSHSEGDSPQISRMERPQGRSMLRELAEERARREKSSEAMRDGFGVTAERRPDRNATQSLREQPRVGEPRFPLLQKTVDDMARESQLDTAPHAMSMTSQSTMSPTSEEIHTPQDDEPPYPLSPMPISPRVGQASSSYESSRPRSFRRSASQRWRDGEPAQDFFGRAGSLRKSYKDPSGFKSSSRRGTFSSNTTNSVASSFLRGFSMYSNDGENAPPPAVDAEGQTIGEDYVIGKQIGFGGFSVIKEVTQLSAETGQQRKLAVKIVRRNIDGKAEAENEAVQAEFEHEVELWRFLSHGNVLPLESVYKLDEATFCFIPLNVGGTLFDLVRSNRSGLSLDLARNYAYQLVSALRYLHLDARVVHRDVKLENCLIDTTKGSPGVLRLCDFGMAEWIENDQGSRPRSSGSDASDRPAQKVVGPADSSSSGFAGGSLEYAPPEILRNANLSPISPTSSEEAFTKAPVENVPISSAVDIWAFGVCLYSLIVGKRPFSNSLATRLIKSILDGEWDRDLVLEKSGGDEDLLELLEGCLTRDQNRRWDIRRVSEAGWFAAERTKLEDSQDDRPNQWRL